MSNALGGLTAISPEHNKPLLILIYATRTNRYGPSELEPISISKQSEPWSSHTPVRYLLGCVRGLFTESVHLSEPPALGGSESQICSGVY